MFYSPPLDAAGLGLVVVFLGFGFFMCVVGIPILESIVLYILKWAEYGRCLGASYAMNFVSLIGGVPVYILFQNHSVQNLISALTRPFERLISQTMHRYTDLSFVIYLFVCLVVSILVEGWILNLINKSDRRRSYKFAVIANLASYAVLIPPFHLFGVV